MFAPLKKQFWARNDHASSKSISGVYKLIFDYFVADTTLLFAVAPSTIFKWELQTFIAIANWFQLDLSSGCAITHSHVSFVVIVKYSWKQKAQRYRKHRDAEIAT